MKNRNAVIAKTVWPGALLLACALLASAPLLAQTPPQSQGQTGQAGQPPPPEDAEQRAAAASCITTTNQEERIRLCEEFVTKYAESGLLGFIYANLAEAHRKLNHYAQAVEFGEKALEKDPGHVFSKLLVADSLAEEANPTQLDYQQKLERASTLAQEAVAELPAYLDSLPRREGVPEEEYQRQRNATLGLAHGTLGYIHLRRQQNAEAEEQLKQAVKLAEPQPNSTDMVRLGAAYQRLRKWQEARDIFKRVVDSSHASRADKEYAQQRLEAVERNLAATQPKPASTPAAPPQPKP